MKKKDVLLPYRPEGTVVFGAVYNKGATEAADLAAAKAALKPYCLLLDTSWAADNGGIYETTTTTGITSVAQGDGATKHPAVSGYTELATDVVITMARAWEFTDPYTAGRKIIPTVYYKGEEVPIEDMKHIGDGFTAADFVLIVDNTGQKYGAAAPTAADWSVCLVGNLRGIKSADVGAVDLPVEETSHTMLGNSEPAVKRRKNSGLTNEGSLTITRHAERLYVASGAGTGATAPAEILNAPGEDTEIILLPGWSKGQENRRGYLPDGKAIAILKVNFSELATVPDGSGIHLQGDGAANAGKAFCTYHLIHGCSLTNRGANTNEEGGSTENVESDWGLSSPYGTIDRTLLTAA